MKYNQIPNMEWSMSSQILHVQLGFYTTPPPQLWRLVAINPRRVTCQTNIPQHKRCLSPETPLFFYLYIILGSLNHSYSDKEALCNNVRKGEDSNRWSPRSNTADVGLTPSFPRWIHTINKYMLGQADFKNTWTQQYVCLLYIIMYHTMLYHILYITIS